MAIQNQAIWRPPFPQATRTDAFRRYLNTKYGINLKNYAELHQWSVDELETFCAETWTFLGMVHSKSPTKTAIGLDKMWPRPQWFPGARLNYTENILATGLALHPDAIAVSGCSEGGVEWRHLTWKQLRRGVEEYASALRRANVQKGDRVATCTTNSIETLLILLATGSIGAIFSSTAPDMGASGIIERYLQVRPKLLFVDSEVMYGGAKKNFRNKMSQVVQTLQSRVKELQRTVVVKGEVFAGKQITSLSRFLEGPSQELTFEQVPFDHPIYILYSSGTTGPPKCICHAGGAALLQQKKELIFALNLGPDSTYYQYTTTGWMMWNYMVAGLSCGSRIVLYDGSPLYPSPHRQLEILAQQNVTVWGTSPKFLSALMQAKSPAQTIDLSSLEYAQLAGSPLSAEQCEWFYRTFPARVGLFSGSGGTDLVGGIVGGSPISPLYKGELATAYLGMKVEVWDDNGQNIENTGERGELVITKPFFSMPITFWGEGGEAKYRKAYFENFPGIWCHGDYIRRNPTTGGYEILGRSDGVLNPGGVRFGTAELYGVIDKFSEVEDCIAVGQPLAGSADEQVLLFLKLKNKATLDESLRERVRTAIRNTLSARHVPSYVLQVADIPYTANGKKIENLVRDVVSGKEAKVGGTAVNPECLVEYKRFIELSRGVSKAKL